jgi:hypothetical protein
VQVSPCAQQVFTMLPAPCRRLPRLCRERGFVVDLPEANVNQTKTILRLLEAGNWLDTQTRALFIEFSLYLHSADLLLAARLVVEVHPTGTIWTDMSLEPVNLSVYTVANRAVMALQVMGALVALSAMAWELWHARNMRMHHGIRTSAVRPLLFHCLAVWIVPLHGY